MDDTGQVGGEGTYRFEDNCAIYIHLRGIEVDGILNIRLIQGRAPERTNTLPLAHDAGGPVGDGDAIVGEGLVVKIGPVGVHARDLDGERVGVLRELARVEEDDVEGLVGGRGEDVKVPKVGAAAGRGRGHLEAVEVSGLGEVLHAYGAVGVGGLEVDGARG